MNTSQNISFSKESVAKFQNLHSLIKLKKSIKTLYKQNKLEDQIYNQLLEILTHNYHRIVFNLTIEENKHYLKDDSFVSLFEFNDKYFA